MNEEILEIFAELGAELARDIIAHRKGKKCPLTPRGARSLLKQYQLTGNAIEAAETHLNRGWQGFSASWITNERKFTDTHNPMSRAKPLSPHQQRHEDAHAAFRNQGINSNDKFANGTLDLERRDYRSH